MSKQPDKLSIKEVEEIIDHCETMQQWSDAIDPRYVLPFLKQLLDIIRENDRLRETLETLLLATDGWKSDDAFHDARINARKVLNLSKESGGKK